jgi:hypothetical protein
LPWLTLDPPRSPINGEVYNLIPGSILLFEPPDDAVVAAAGQIEFTDVDGRRYFSSAFYAALLAHLGAALVVSFDRLPPPDADAQRDAYAAAGLGYCTLEDLGGSSSTAGGGAGRMSLQSLDRFISLAAGCPGLVAALPLRTCLGGLSES